MSDKSAIEWTDATWNPIRAHRFGAQVNDPGWRTQQQGGGSGWYCEHVSEGCRNCYAERMNNRMGTRVPFKPGYRDRVRIVLSEKTLVQPLQWKQPRMIFVCSMSDLFGPWVTDEMLDRVFAVMALCPQHTFQMLTKRPERMRAYLSTGFIIRDAISAAMWPISNRRTDHIHGGLPLGNVWLGTSCEDQPTADERIPHLQATPAAIRFLSLEPLLGPMRPDLAGISWVIVGGESGPNARPMEPGWARAIRDQCAGAGVAFFFKQFGEWALRWPGDRSEGQCLERVGKKRAGRLLDGMEHNAIPSRPT